MSKQQLALALRLDRGASFDNFFVGNDQALVLDALRRQASCGGEKFILLHGLEGISHLLQGACLLAESCGRSSYYLSLKDFVDFDPAEVLEGVEQFQLICLDDIEVILGHSEWERGLFNLYNRVLQSEGCLLFSSHRSPAGFSVALPDLRSRLQAFSIFYLPVLTESERIAAFQFRASRRGMPLSASLAEYVFHRCQRDFSSLMQVLEKLDNSSLAEKRMLTIPFVKSVMDW